MRKIIGSLATVLVALIIISMSCCDVLNDVLPVPSMKASVDGEAWTSKFRLSVLNETDGNIVITGTPEVSENVDKALILTVFATDAGTYNLTPGTLTTDCGVVYKKTANSVENDDNYFVSYEATVTISELNNENKRMSGTFNAKCITTTLPPQEVIITNGTFENLNYQIK